jgi:hypothetical protein
MKKLIVFLIFISVIAGIALTDSCKKDTRIRGCVDKDAKNYNSSAQVDDGSCTYEGYMIVWYDSTASAGLIKDGATALTFTLDGQVIGSSATSVFWTAAPDCGQNGSITVTEQLGHAKSQTFTLSVKDQTGFEYWNAQPIIKANTCLMFELTWSKRKKK